MDLRRASRPMCVLLLLIGAVWTTAPHAAENPPVPAPQLNANLITLVGNARFSIFEGDGDESTFVVTTAALGERRYQLEDLPGGVLFVEDPNLVGWTVRVLTSIGIDEDDCLDPAHPCLPADVEVDRVGANRYELRLEEEVDGGIVDDVIMLLETGATPGPAAPLLLPPPNAAHATFVCLGDKCLYTYGQLTTIDREPLAEYIGLESPGNFVGGKREVSSFLAMSEELGPGAIIGPFDPCPIFQTPADPFSPTGLSFLAGLNAPKHCGSTGAVTGGAYAVSDFGKLKAYASLTAEQYPLLPQPAAGVGFRIYSNAGVADVLLFDDDTRLPGNVINRTVRYTFRVDGEVARAGAGAFTDGGFCLRG